MKTTQDPRSRFRCFLDTVFLGGTLLLLLWALSMATGCGGQSVTTIDVENDIAWQSDEQRKELAATAAEPLAMFADRDVQPDVPHGFVVSEVHGLYGRIPFDTEHTVAFAEEFPDDFMLAALDGIEDAAWMVRSRFDLRLHDEFGKPDVLVRHATQPLSRACTGEDPEGTCWTGHADCMNSVALGGGFYACRQWEITMNLPNMRAWAEASGKPIAEVFATLFEHEVLHTLGLAHGYGIMAPLVFIADTKDNRPILDPCQSAILFAYHKTEEPGLRVEKTPDWCL